VERSPRRPALRELETPRLRLVAQTTELGRAESDGAMLARRLGAEVPPTWPPLEMRSALGSWCEELATSPDLVGWVNWYWLARRPARDVLVGYGGFKGLPSPEGVVEIGYAVLSGQRRRGYAFEALGELLRWAWADPRVRRIDAETRWELTASVRLLAKLGFRLLPETDPEVLRYALQRPRTF